MGCRATMLRMHSLEKHGPEKGSAPALLGSGGGQFHPQPVKGVAHFQLA